MNLWSAGGVCWYKFTDSEEGFNNMVAGFYWSYIEF